MSPRSLSSARVSRRMLIESSAAAMTGALVLGRDSVAQSTGSAFSSTASSQESVATPDGWRMWLLESPDALRPEAPAEVTEAEISEVVQAQADSTDETAEIVARWGSGVALLPWSSLAEELTDEFGIGGMPQSRFMAIYHTALHDAVIAAWDAQVAFARPGPGATSDQIVPAAGIDPERPSFPAAHATIAGAAATVLAYLLPDAAAGRFDTLATEAAESRIAAGASFRSDIEAGLALGQAVGDVAVTRARADGADATWDPATMPTGPGFWQPTPPDFVEMPAAPLAGSRQPWVMTSGDQVRPAPPPEYGSPAWEAELKMVQEVVANLSFEQERAALWWGNTSPPGLLNGWTRELIGKAGVDLPHAAQILADVHAAMADALIAVWDAKYTWWTSRPITEDPDLNTVLSPPPYPAYPSGYSGAIGAGSTVIGHYFPEMADEMANRAWEAAASRCWGGIHYVIDDDVALTMGRQVGRLICALPGANPVDDA